MKRSRMMLGFGVCATGMALGGSAMAEHRDGAGLHALYDTYSVDDSGAWCSSYGDEETREARRHADQHHARAHRILDYRVGSQAAHGDIHQWYGSGSRIHEAWHEQEAIDHAEMHWQERARHDAEHSAAEHRRIDREWREWREWHGRNSHPWRSGASPRWRRFF